MVEVEDVAGAVAALQHREPFYLAGALAGPNGAGESSVINSLLGPRQPSAGRIRIAGLPPRAAVGSGYVGAMQQAAGLPSGARVMEYVCAPLDPRRRRDRR